MPNRMIHALYHKAIREAATEAGRKKLENNAMEDVLMEGGMM